MITRCYVSSDTNYTKYGAKGVRVCPGWRNSFVQFYADMGPCPPFFTIEREDNFGDYTPDNCRWASPYEQNRNKSSNRFLTFNGQTKCITDWSESLGVPVSTLTMRLDAYGWTIEQALTSTPPKRSRSKTSITWNGETRDIQDWAKLQAITVSCLRHRLKRGWDLTAALTTPMEKRRIK